jgi:putative DNA primase/helicase
MTNEGTRPETQEEQKAFEVQREKVNGHARIAKLAQLSLIEYDQQRVKEAKQIGVRVSVLDAEVKKLRDNGATDNLAGQPLVFEELEPWPEPVNGAALLKELTATLEHFVVLLAHAAHACALWTAHTYAFDLRHCSPILAVRSPEKRCGKTTLLALLLSLVNRPLPASNISPSAVYRTIDKVHPTLLIDEADSFLRDNEELRGVLNSGHTRELAFVIRNVGNDLEPRKFSTWAPKAIALIGKLRDTLHDRSIVIPMQRKRREDRVERFDGTKNIGHELKRKLARWINDNGQAIAAADPAIPSGLHDRAADNWRPMLALADLAGGKWPELSRKAAVALSGGAEEEDESKRVLLLADLRQLFAGRGVDRLTSEDIVTALVDMPERPWSEITKHGKPINQRYLADSLRDFRIQPKQVWVGERNRRGYELGQFHDVFWRYLDTLSAKPLDPNNDAAFGDFLSARNESGLADEKTRKPAPGKGPSGLADPRPWSTRI